VPVADVAQLQRLLQAPEPDTCRAILESWDSSLAVSLAFLLGFDFLYDLVHNNAAALFAVWGAVRRDTAVARRIAGTTAWVLWLDSGLNIFENLAFLHILRSQSCEGLLTAVAAIFTFRSATLLLGFVVGAALHASAWRASRLTSR